MLLLQVIINTEGSFFFLKVLIRGKYRKFFELNYSNFLSLSLQPLSDMVVCLFLLHCSTLMQINYLVITVKIQFCQFLLFILIFFLHFVATTHPQIPKKKQQLIHLSHPSWITVREIRIKHLCLGLPHWCSFFNIMTHCLMGMMLLWQH